MNNLISIIVPVYNTETYLRKCLNSIINQTHKELEIILVDDGSTDKSGEICDEYAGLDERVKVIHQSNCGQASARNRALEILTGDYLGFVDSDDYIEDDMYELLYTSSINQDAAIAICGYSRVSETGKIIHTYLPSENAKVIPKKEAVFELLKSTKICSILCDKLYKRELFLGIQFPEGKTFEDLAILYQVVDRAGFVVLCPYSKYAYVMRMSSTVNNRNIMSYYNQFEALQNQLEFAMVNYPEAIMWVEYHMTEVMRSILICNSLNKSGNIESDKNNLMIKYRKLLKFIWLSDATSISRKMKALIFSFIPSGYIQYQLARFHLLKALHLAK